MLRVHSLGAPCASQAELTKVRLFDEHRTLSRMVEQRIGCLCVLDGCGSCAIAFADLVHSELAPANPASPARRRRLRDSRHRVVIGAPGWYEFATALRTPSLDHKPSGQTEFS